jgi:hypothetical protein
VRVHAFQRPEALLPAPDFCLTSAAGDTICASVYRQRLKQVLWFPAGSSPADWVPALHALGEHAEEYSRMEAAVLALVPASAEAIRGLDRGRVRQAYESLLGGDTGTGHLVFVLDAFQTPYAAIINADPAEPALFEQIEQWLSFISVQCPE